ncbi:MAG: MBL fold metallo-hydrolase [Gemmatimonadaceae bacterium]|nr:MBL fold metallo-hydrolase [Gemmatimonadaceae bacterium]
MVRWRRSGSSPIRHQRRVGAPSLVALLVAASLGIGCRRAVAPLIVPQHATVVLTGGSNTSMIYLARTTAGVLAIDLGWWGYRRSLDRALDSLGATVSDVRWVFLTHSHRDHIAAWPTFNRARFFVSGDERPLLLGTTAHRGWIPRWTEYLKSSRTPRPGELDVHTFTQDTIVVVGADTVRAFQVAGHTPGSVVYLFRGVLFLGDAVTYSRWGGFAPAKRGFSDNPRAGAENLARLWARLPPGAVRYACTAHAHCAPFTSRFLADVAQ